MEKLKIGNIPFMYPIPAILAGTIVDGKVNYTTLGNCGIMSVNPAVIYISSERTHCLNAGIKNNGFFSVNIPSTNLVQKTDFCGLLSGNKGDKSEVFETFYGEFKDVPLIKECPVNLVCKVINKINIHDMEVFVGEVVEVFIDKDCFTDGEPDTEKIDPLIYTMDNNYWSIGSKVGSAFCDGTKYQKLI